MSRHAHQLFENLQRLISTCLNSPTASLSQARQAHAHILTTGLSNDTRFTTKLLSLYATHLCHADASLVLDSIPQPDVFSFSTLIYAFSRSGNFGCTLHLFSRMLRENIMPDAHVIPSIVKACTGLSALKPGKQVHGFVSTSGLLSDRFVQSSLIHLYVKCDRLSDANQLFDLMPEPSMVSLSAIISGYARQGNVSDAKKAFDRMEELRIEPNLVLWNGMIAGFNQSGHYLEAVSMFQKMYLMGFKPDGTSVSSVVSAVGDLQDLTVGIQLHCYAIRQGLGVDKYVVSALIIMYSKFACTSEMSQVFDDMDQFDLAVCNALLAGFSRNGLIDDVVRLFEQFQSQGTELNVVSWTSMISGCTQHGKDIEALELFRKMQIAGVEPNCVTIPCLLPACGNIAALMHGKAAHGFSLRREICDDVYVGSALVDMYSNCGRIQAARIYFDRMPIRNRVCWNAMIGGYAMHGKTKDVIEIFDLMQRREQKPDVITFTSLLSACSHSGLTEEGQSYFYSMSREHGIEPRVEHYACMVALLGRSGKLEEAYSMIREMPFEPDACVWGALLSSCRVHHSLCLAEVAANKLFVLEPNNPGNYILLSNIYASKGKWHEVDKMRDLMKGMGLRKNPGCSWIEVKNKVHMLLAGDKSHPQMTQIIEKMDKLSIKMKKSGHLPLTDFVLQDVEDQEKEHILCGHSEKLAVVFGLLNTPPGSPLQVIKNLRICEDCHVVIKFISSFEGREIFVRDTNRFHHFKDGVCSCGDYW